MKKYFKFVLLLGISLIFLTGCVSDLVVPENNVNSPETEGSSAYENPADGLGTGKGTLKIYLTDAPGDYKEVNINISRIDGHIALEDEEGYWEILKDWPDGLPIDLLTLEDVSILLASLELEPNKYTQLRLFLMGEEGDAWLVLNDSFLTEKPLEIPSVYQTGIKLNRPFEIVAGSITKLTIDFDAEKSVIKTGNGKYKMKPVIHVTSETYSEGEELPEGSGSVSGSVSYYGYDSEGLELILVGIVGASVELTGGVYIFANTATTLEDGSFSLVNVPAGTYTLNVVAEGYDDYSESIEVIAGSDTEVNVVLLSGGISGIVKEEGSESTFIVGATVTVILSGGDIFNSSASTNESGEFVFEQLPVGFYTLTVSADGYSFYSHADEIEVIEGETTENIEIELIPE
jgi:hypothetical protein